MFKVLTNLHKRATNQGPHEELPLSTWRDDSSHCTELKASAISDGLYKPKSHVEVTIPLAKMEQLSVSMLTLPAIETLLIESIDVGPSAVSI